MGISVSSQAKICSMIPFAVHGSVQVAVPLYLVLESSLELPGLQDATYQFFIIYLIPGQA
jgi:hypothetical protein